MSDVCQHLPKPGFLTRLVFAYPAAVMLAVALAFWLAVAAIVVFVF